MIPIEVRYFDKSRKDKKREGIIKAFQHGEVVCIVHNTPFGCKEKLQLPLYEFGVFMKMLSRADIDHLGDK